MGGFALVFVPAWIAFRRARSWGTGLVLVALVGPVGYVAAFLLALAPDQPCGADAGVASDRGGFDHCMTRCGMLKDRFCDRGK